MDRHQTAARLTPREREIAGLIAKGLTNKQIGRELSVSERTVGAHVQNMLNKLSASNRAEIAVVAANHRPTADASAAIATRPVVVARPAMGRLLVVPLLAAALLVAATDDGQRIDGASPAPAPTAQPSPVIPGTLVFEAALKGDGAGFGERNYIGDQQASAIRFSRGAVEYAVIVPGGLTGNGVDIAPLKRYYTDITARVEPGSGVSFWLQLDSPGPKHPGQHLVAIDTWRGQLQLNYFVDHGDLTPLSDTIRVDGLEQGREVTIGALVDPPHYVVFVNGIRVIDVQHSPGASLQSPAFTVMGQDVGAVRLTSVRVYVPS